jgi:hypothetical protein
LKEEMIQKENKMIIKKDKEARKLEILEAEVLKRLRDTHVKQQQALEQIQTIFQNRSPGPDVKNLNSSIDLNHVEFRQPYNQAESEGIETPNALNTVSEAVGGQESQEIKNHRAS